MIQFIKPARKIHSVFLHCSASDHSAHDDIAVIKQWHLRRGFHDVGYHYFIQKNGNIQKGRPLANIPAAQSGFNRASLAICLHGLTETSFTTEQFRSLKELCYKIQESHTAPLRFRGHREVSMKTCPVFDYRAILDLDDHGFLKTFTSYSA